MHLTRTNRKWFFLLSGCLLILSGCLCLTIALGSYLTWQFRLSATRVAQVGQPGEATVAAPSVTPTATPLSLPSGSSTTVAVTRLPTPSPATPAPQALFHLAPPAEIEQRAVPFVAYHSLEALLDSYYPPHDYYETAVRYGRRHVGDRIISRPPYQIGDEITFQTDSTPITAELLAVTEHAYFWVEEGVAIDETALATAAERFETEYYSPVTDLIGHEWQPGIDNDPHFSILHLQSFSDREELGYFVSADEYPRTVDSRSNEQEIIYLNMAYLEVGSDLYYGTLVHELEHLIHWHVDSNEATWLDEGLAQLSEIYVGLDTASAAEYLHRPGTQLNSWEYEDENAVYAHYGAAYLFTVYFWEQLGEAAVQELARHPANGLASVHAVLHEHQPARSLEQFMADWMAATFLDDEEAGSRYRYEHLQLSQPRPARTASRFPFEMTAEVSQFGVDYIELQRSSETTISFVGDTLAAIIPAAPPSGQRMWLVPPHDNLNARLTGAFDLTGLSQATLSFQTWFDLEEEWDYAYVAISVDNGRSWELLMPEHASPGVFGPGFNGRSEEEAGNVAGWLQESISLDAYIGQPVLIRFELLTDSSVTGRGFALDDIAIPELGYFDDVEADPAELILPWNQEEPENDSQWHAEGYVASSPQLPQRWSVQLLETNGSPLVTPLLVDDFNQGQWRMDLGSGNAVLAIAPLTPFINEPARYWLKVE